MKNLNALAMSMMGVAMILPSCKGDRQQQQQAEAPELSVITVGEESARLESGIPCTLQGENDVEIRPQIQGFLTRVNVEEGQHVSKGQTLFVIDQVQLQAAVDAAKAQVEVAKASVNTAQTNANNNKILLDKNIISAPAYQTSVDALNAAKAQYNAALANLTSARKNLSYTNVTAPISGVIGSIDFKEGSLVSPQTLLTVVSNNADMQANFSFNEKDILAMTDNGRRSIDEAIRQLPPVTLLMANGERYGIPGKVTAVSGVIDPNTGSASAKAIFRNPDGMLHSGNTGQIPERHACATVGYLRGAGHEIRICGRRQQQGALPRHPDHRGQRRQELYRDRRPQARRDNSCGGSRHHSQGQHADQA